MAKYGRYTQEFKDALVQKVLLSANGSIEAISREAGVPSSTLENWVRKYRKQNGGGDVLKKKINNWEPADKFDAVVLTVSMNNAERSEYCRRTGLYPETLEQWKLECIAGCGGAPLRTISRKRDTREKEWEIKAKSLEKELNRKEKALAETAALLVLKKKAYAIWGDPRAEK